MTSKLALAAAALLVAPLVSAPPAAAANPALGDPPAVTGGNLTKSAIARSVTGALDTQADPCVDFYRYACGSWLDSATLPADQPIWVRSFSVIHESNREFLKTAIENAAKNPGDDPDRKRVGDYYGACMDEAAVARAGLAPLAPWLAKIAAAPDGAAIFALAGELQAINAEPFLAIDVDGDLKDPRTVVAHLMQGGLGLPDRDYYLSDDEKKTELRAAYEKHVARMLVHLGAAPEAAAASAAKVLAFETALARVSREVERMRVYDELHHRLDAAGLAQLAPKLSWERFYAGLGRTDLQAINVMTPEFFVGLEREIGRTDAATLQDYLRFQLVTATATLLPDAVYLDHFDFYARALSGQQEPQPRWKRCISATEQAMGEAIGKLYVAQRFTGESKRIATAMLDDLAAAFAASLPALDWMDEETRAAALVKKGTLGRKIGFPDRWRDYSRLAVDRGDYFGSALAARRFETDRQIAKVGGPLDPAEWGMDAQTVNAGYNPLVNMFTYPAGILQPPFFHKDYPAAINYGAMGYVMGHELTHGFDDQGRKFDAQGRLSDWWTPASVAAFEQRAACIEKQYSAYEVEPGVAVNGKLTLGENIADNGGLKQAWDAFQELKKRNGGKAETVPGLTADQLFFVAAAQVWCTESSPEFQRLLVQTDEHAPSQFRVKGPALNHPAFARAFSCKAGTPMNPPAADRCEVW
jgi:predicted metalloendopeptidase